MAFKYIAVDSSGKKVSGIVKENSKKKALRLLSSNNYTVISIESYDDFNKKSVFKDAFLMSSKISGEEKIILNLQFANLLSANVPITEALEIISSQTRRKHIRESLREIKANIEKGVSIYNAFKKSGIFDELTINMIKAGEESSQLDIIFYKLSSFAERNFQMMQNVKSIVTYPLILLGMGFFLTIVAMSFVFPKFVEVFESQGIITLPLVTEMVAKISMFFAKFWGIILIVIMIFVYFFRRFLNTKKGKLFMSQLMIKLPIVKDLVSKLEFSSFLYSMHLLLSSGVDIIDSINYASGTLRNVVYREYISSIKEDLKKGKSFSDLLRNSPYVPEMAVRLISIGDKTGEFETFLERAASYMETMFSYQIKRLLVFVEPVILIFMGILVGTLMASFILPLFRMIRVMH